MMGVNKEWLESLKVGDKVFVRGHFTKAIRPVEKINKGSIKVGGTLYNKTDGYQKGGDVWYRTYIEEVTDDILKEVQRENKAMNIEMMLHGLDCKKFTLEQLEELEALIKKFKNGN